jgi:hypothetical protein
MSTLPIILEVLGARGVHDALKGVEADAKKAGAGLAKAAGSGARAFESTAERTYKGFQKSSNAIEARAQKVKNRMEKIGSSATAQMGGAASLGLGLFANAAISAGDEAEAANLKLEAMLNQRGYGNSLPALQKMANEVSKLSGIDDDDIAQAGAGLLGFGLNAKQVAEVMPNLVAQAQLYNQSLDGVAMTFGKSFASGNAGALKKAGVTLSQADMDAIKAKKSISEAAGQLELFNRVQESMRQYAPHLGAGMSKAQLARLYAQNQGGNVFEGIGQAAGRTRAGWQSRLTPLAERVAASPGLTNALGAGLEGASMSAPILTFMATVGQSLPTFEKAGELFGKMKDGAGLLKGGMGAATFAIKAESAAAFLNGNANLIAADKVGLAGATSAAGVGALLVPLGLLATAAAGVYVAIKGSQDASTMSSAALRKKWGAIGGVWDDAGGGLGSIIDKVSGTSSKSDELDRKLKSLSKSRGGHKGLAAAHHAAVTAAVKPAHHMAATAEKHHAALKAIAKPKGVAGIQRALLVNSLATAKNRESAELKLALFDAKTQEAAEKPRAKLHVHKKIGAASDALAGKRGALGGKVGDFYANRLIVGGSTDETIQKAFAKSARTSWGEWKGGHKDYEDVDLDPRERARIAAQHTARSRTGGTTDTVTLKLQRPPGRIERAAMAYP